MPVYEYECESCGHQFEVWQKITDPPLNSCEKCGGKVRKLISQSTFILKGSGWYVTDYARKEKGKDTKEASSSKGEGSSGSTEKKS